MKSLECEKCGKIFSCRCTRYGICQLVLRNRGEVGELVKEGQCYCDDCSTDNERPDDPCEIVVIKDGISKFKLSKRWTTIWEIQDAISDRNELTRLLNKKKDELEQLRKNLRGLKKDYEKEYPKGFMFFG